MPRRFFCTPIPAAGQIADLDDAESHHLRTVLRARDGMEVELLDGAGRRAQAAVIADAARRGPVSVRVQACRQHPRPALRLVLYVAPPRARLMDGLVRQATELGVWAIQPVLTEYAVATPSAKAVDGWLQQARDACKQSGNPFLPAIRPPLKLDQALSPSTPPGYIAWLDPDSHVPAEGHPSAELVGELAVWIGPEGGFTPDEARAIRAHRASPLGLGPWILRVETAVVAALALLQAQAPPDPPAVPVTP